MVLVWMQYFKKLIQYFPIIFLWLVFGLQANVSASEDNLIVIGNQKSTIKKLSSGQIQSIFLGKTSKIDGQVVRGYHQPSGSTQYNDFFQTIWIFEKSVD